VSKFCALDLQINPALKIKPAGQLLHPISSRHGQERPEWDNFVLITRSFCASAVRIPEDRSDCLFIRFDHSCLTATSVWL
jgi:hypothetical protein